MHADLLLRSTEDELREELVVQNNFQLIDNGHNSPGETIQVLQDYARTMNHADH